MKNGLLIFLVIWVAASLLIARRPGGRTLVKAAGGGFIAAALVAALASVIFMPVKSEQKLQPAATPAQIQPMSLGFTPEQLSKRFNDQATNRGVEYRINGITLKPNTPESDKWLYQFTNRIGFLAVTNKGRGDIRSITYMASGDGTLESGANMMFVLMTLIHAIDPALTDETTNKLALDLLEVFKKGTPVERVVNGVQYGSAHMENVGLFLAINPVQ